ncbi:MAG: helix-turn-helix domain-containing protein, partial [Gemmatimonadales bacterium]
MLLTRSPRPVLRPFIKTLWAIDRCGPAPLPLADRERVLPTGSMNLALRLSDHPLRIFDTPDDPAGKVIGYAVAGGARNESYIRDISGPVRSVGAQLHPGASELLLGVPAGELAGRHTSLEELWGGSAALMSEQLLDAGTPERQLDLFETILIARLPRVYGIHPAVAHALDRFRTTFDVGEVVRQTGYSHRRFIALFQDAVGLTPKLYCRILRFQRVLLRGAADPSLSWVELALNAGYADQSHFNRDFREFTGATPGEYRRVAPSLPNHVPV